MMKVLKLLLKGVTIATSPIWCLPYAIYKLAMSMDYESEEEFYTRQLNK